MSFAERILDAANPGRRCQTGKWLDGLSNADAEAFATYAQAVQLKDLHALMRDEGFKFGRDVVSRHLRGECICDVVR